MSKKQLPQEGSQEQLWKVLGKGLMIVIALVAMVMYFKPVQKKNTVLMQSDIVQGRGMSKEISDFRKANGGEEPLWTGSMFGGMPAFQISTLYPNDIIYEIDQALKMRWAFGHPVGQTFVLFLGMFFLLSMLKIDPITAGVGAFAFMLCSYTFIATEAGHNSKINAMSYVPAVLAGILLLYRGKLWLGAALTALFLALELNANHFQVAYYMFFIIGTIVITEYAKYLSVIGKAFLFGGLLLIPLIWLSPIPDSLWRFAAVLAVLGPIVYELLANIKQVSGAKISALLKGVNLPENLVGLRRFTIASLVLGASVLLAVGPNVARLWTTSEYAKETIRGKQVRKNRVENQVNDEGLAIDYAFQWSYGVAETFTLINSNYYGGASGYNVGKDSRTHDILQRKVGRQAADALVTRWPTYFGDVPFTSGPVYLGIIICFLFFLGLIVVPGNARWWLLSATILGMMIAWGRNFMGFNEMMFYNFPFFDRFRAVSQGLIIVQITMPILASLGLYHFYQRSKTEDRKVMLTKVGIAAGITALLLVIMLIGQPGTGNFSLENDAGRIGNILNRNRIPGVDQAMVTSLVSALEADRASLLTAGVMRGFLYLILGSGVLLAYLYFLKDAFKGKQAKYGMYIASAAILVMVSTDLWKTDKEYLNDENFVKENQFLASLQPSKADQMILQDPDPDFRVLNLMRDPWNDASTSYHHKAIGGYHPAKLRRYNDLIAEHLSPEIDKVIGEFRAGSENTVQKVQAMLANSPTLRMMNLKYIIYNGAAAPMQNDKRLGNAWFVDNFEVLENPDLAIERMHNIDPGRTAVVEKADAGELGGFSLKKDPAAQINLVTYKANYLKYQANVPGNNTQLAVFSEIYYNSGKGWQAYLDGNPVSHFRVDYVLRAMKVPSGKHTIEFKFEPRSFRLGGTISLIFSIILLAAVGGALFMEYRQLPVAQGGKKS
ncbi:MAG TPA: hypothetical protein ENJ82_06705 [Bacteroidetes bacterium]|nr:hypothetical protein [Bacteroidota bacterium]